MATTCMIVITIVPIFERKFVVRRLRGAKKANRRVAQVMRRAHLLIHMENASLRLRPNFDEWWLFIFPFVTTIMCYYL